MKLPDNFDSWNPAFRAAYRKGAAAAGAGVPLSGCPYEDKRKSGGQITWSRSFITAWRDGWTDWNSSEGSNRP